MKERENINRKKQKTNQKTKHWSNKRGHKDCGSL